MAPIKARIAERIHSEPDFTKKKSAMKKSIFYIILFSVLIPVALWNIPAHSTSNDKPQTYQLHTVKAGDSLSKIAYEYYGDYTKVSIIAESNNIKDINSLKIGQKIKIPVLTLEQYKKPSRVQERDLDLSKQGETETLEEKSLNKGMLNSRLGRPAVIFIIICLLAILTFVLTKWLGLKDAPRIHEPNDDVRPGSERRKWRMK